MMVLAMVMALGMNDAAPPPLEPHGVLIKAADFDAAAAFYSEALDLPVRSESDGWIEFDVGTPFRLTQAAITNPSLEARARTSLVFHTTSLDETRARWEAAGVTVTSPQPNVNGVGRDIRFTDPEGNSMSVMELADQPDGLAADGRQIYNYGFTFNDVTEERALFSSLGFPALTERYFPPALPLRDQNGGFGFMLHQNPGVAPGDLQGPDSSGLVVVFQSSDLEAVQAALVEAGHEPTLIPAEQRGGRVALWIHVGEGVGAEIWGPEAP